MNVDKETLQRAYLEIFSTPDKRIGALKIVMDDLHRLGFYNGSVIMSLTDGSVDPLRLAINSGQQRVVSYIEENVRAASTLKHE
jgi:hypothetical protein